jgi:hypothetical protein
MWNAGRGDGEGEGRDVLSREWRLGLARWFRETERLRAQIASAKDRLATDDGSAVDFLRGEGHRRRGVSASSECCLFACAPGLFAERAESAAVEARTADCGLLHCFEGRIRVLKE